jgi:nucleotide-binding universal stress UspA family protein
VLPHEMDWTSLRALSRTALSQARDALAPDARTTIETDHSVARALQRVVEREHRDLLVVGSSRQAADGTVRIGKRTRQLLCHFCSALAIAPRGLRTQPDLSLARIGVGYDASPESGAALALGAAIAAAAGGDLQVRSVVDDRMPGLGWDSIWTGDMMADWRQIVQREMDALRDRAIVATRAAGVTADVEAVAGRPADVLAALSREVDLLVIGSRRWGPVARLLLGSTGEALLHNAASPVIAVPRPAG